jgi:hypothetical protein
MVTGYTNILSHAGNPWKCNNTGPLPRNTLSNKCVSPEMKVQYSGGDDDFCKRTSERFNRRSVGLEFLKEATRIFSGLRKVRDSTLLRYQRPPE